MTTECRRLLQCLRRAVQFRNFGDYLNNGIINRNTFGSIQQSDIPIERPFKDLREIITKKNVRGRNIPRNTKPVRQITGENVDSHNRTVITPPPGLIDCSNPEFKENSVDSGKLRLFTRYWEKNKYKNQWIKIRKTLKQNKLAIHISSSTWNDMPEDLLLPSVAASLTSMGFRRPTEIQKQMLRYISSPNHIFLAAETGSGKTIAYAAPIISLFAQRAQEEMPKADQISEVFKKLSENTSVSIRNANFEGNDKPWNILVGTPGRIVGILKKSGDIENVTHVVLEEADILLDTSFVDVITDVFSLVPVAHSETNANRSNGAKLIFCSASCPQELEYLAESVVDIRYLSFVKSNNLHKIIPAVDITLIRLREMDKIDRLVQLLKEDISRGELNQTIVFCKDRETAKFVSDKLKSSSLNNIIWRNSTDKVKIEQSRIIVATDIASRGVDLPRLNHVIHYDMARHVVDFMHRSGRVGRLSSLFPCRVTAFVRTTPEIMVAMKIEAAARTRKPLRYIETDIAGMIERKNNE